MSVALYTALTGFQGNLDRLDEAAVRIARNAPGGDLAGDMVDLLVSQRGAGANLAVIKTSDELLGGFLDLIA